MIRPLFSVLIANYNNGLFLQEAIESVKAQTFSNWEIILVDDASTDDSFTIYEKLKSDPRIHLFFNDSNKGCGYTKRRCAELANGTICGFLDPDDTLEPEALEVMVKAHAQYPNTSMIYSKYYFSDLNLNKIGVSEHQCALPDGVSFLEYGKGAISHFVTYKKVYYDKTPGIDVHYKRAVDHALYYLLEEVGDVHFIDKPLYNYRSNTGSNISTNSNSTIAFMWHLVIMSDACKRRNLQIEDIVCKDFNIFIDDLSNEAFKLGEDKIRATKTYQIGKRLLLPLKWLLYFVSGLKSRIKSPKLP